MTAQALLFTLAVIGTSETAYLIHKRLTQEKPIVYLKCPTKSSDKAGSAQELIDIVKRSLSKEK